MTLLAFVSIGENVILIYTDRKRLHFGSAFFTVIQIGNIALVSPGVVGRTRWMCEV